MKLQVSHIVEEVQLSICVRKRMQIGVARRERQRQRPQQIYMLLPMTCNLVSQLRNATLESKDLASR